MSNGRFASIAVATTAGILGGYYTFKPELDDLQKEKEQKEGSNAAPETKNVVEKPVEEPKLAAEASSPVATTKVEGKGKA